MKRIYTEKQLNPLHLSSTHFVPNYQYIENRNPLLQRTGSNIDPA
jgi:hypothetical protein